MQRGSFLIHSKKSALHSPKFCSSAVLLGWFVASAAAAPGSTEETQLHNSNLDGSSSRTFLFDPRGNKEDVFIWCHSSIKNPLFQFCPTINRLFRPSVYVPSSRNLHRLGWVSGLYILELLWTGTNFGAVLHTIVHESGTVGKYPFFIPLFTRGSPQNDHLLAVCMFSCAQIKKYAALSHCLQIWHRLPDVRVATKG